jgi:hypothetical protein
MREACSTHVYNFWSEILKGRDHSEDLGVEGEDNIRMDLYVNRVGRCELDSSGSG